jgi:hypothetical protein
LNEQPIAGLKVLQVKDNPINGFAIAYSDMGLKDRLVLHYTADPMKDPSTPAGAAVVQELRRALGADAAKWNREYEGDPYSHVGKRLTPGFMANKGQEPWHVQPCAPDPRFRIIRTVDPAWHCSACVWLQIVEQKEDPPQVRILREMRSLKADVAVLGRAMQRVTKEKYADWQGKMLDEIDIAAKAWKGPGSGESAIQVLGQFGFAPGEPRRSSPYDRLTLLNHLIESETCEGEPAFVVDPSCAISIAGYSGLYRQKENGRGIDDTEVVDVMDATGYGVWNHLQLRFERGWRRQAKSKIAGVWDNVRQRLERPESKQPRSWREA